MSKPNGRPAMQIPIKHCENCGKELVRGRAASGKLEQHKNYLKRRFCNNSCAGQYYVRMKAAKKPHTIGDISDWENWSDYGCEQLALAVAGAKSREYAILYNSMIHAKSQAARVSYEARALSAKRFLMYGFTGVLWDGEEVCNNIERMINKYGIDIIKHTRKDRNEVLGGDDNEKTLEDAIEEEVLQDVEKIGKEAEALESEN